jgi:hypothetical protein
VHPGGCQAGSSPAEAILVQRRGAACLWATDGSDASADALPDAAEGACPGPQRHLGEDAEKLADPVPDVLELDALLLPSEHSVPPAPAVPCTPAEVPCGERSYAAMALAGAAAQLAPRVSRPLKLVTVARRRAASQKLEAQLVPPEVAQLLDWQAPLAQLAARPQSLVAGELAVQELKMSVSAWMMER